MQAWSDVAGVWECDRGGGQEVGPVGGAAVDRARRRPVLPQPAERAALGQEQDAGQDAGRTHVHHRADDQQGHLRPHALGGRLDCGHFRWEEVGAV